MPLTFHHKQLPNGLDIVAEVNPDSHSFAAGLFVKTGLARRGAGDQRRVAFPRAHDVQRLGEIHVGRRQPNLRRDRARYNAFTSQEMTAYYANVLPEFTEQAVEHLSHLLRPAIRTSDFDTEKKVILEEIAMYLDDPGHRLYEKLMELHFGIIRWR